MRVRPILFRRIHKWVGLLLGIQFLLWAVSGAMMATLDHHEVSGGREAATQAAPLLPRAGSAWPRVRDALGQTPLRAVSLRPLLGRQMIEVDTGIDVRLFDVTSGRRVRIDRDLAADLARIAHPARAPVERVLRLVRPELAVREHALPIWKVEFADDANSTYYISGNTGAVLERRNDSWRLWDFFWMLHTMDYSNRASFNHPLIVTVAIGAVWLALTGLYLVFKTNWRSEARWLRRNQPAHEESRRS